MFVGRDEELKVLEGLYGSSRFEMAIVYGRRRVGKTALLDRFSRGKNVLYFTAQEESNALNLRRFSAAAYKHFGMPASAGPFQDWLSAFEFVAGQAAKSPDPLLMVFDELPYAAMADASLPSALQIAIDHGFRQQNCCIALCGSNEGFMESQVLGQKSPLYGRRTAQIRLQPFDCLDALRMLPDVTSDQAIRYYATFGGTPYYLEQIDHELSYEQNIAKLIFRTSGLLYGEPSLLLRQELREPATYNSALTAIAHGATAPKAIAEQAGIARESVNQYLKTLVNLGILERVVPFGANPDNSRKSRYSIADPFFAFWYRFVGPCVDAIELGIGEAVARGICEGQALPAYEGGIFERVCHEWVARANRASALPFLVTMLGRWWGEDPALREQADIDLVAANPGKRQVIFGECKWRNAFDETEALQTLEHRSSLVNGSWNDIHYFLFTKNDVSSGARKKVGKDARLHVVTANEMLTR